MVRFDDVLRLTGIDGGVDARGPLDPNETMLELCAWVFQRRDDDAAATEMSTTGGEIEFPPGDPRKWRMVLSKVGNATLAEGEAFAVAVALMKNADGNQRIVWWGHPVTLIGASAAA